MSVLEALLKLTVNWPSSPGSAAVESLAVTDTSAVSLSTITTVAVSLAESIEMSASPVMTLASVTITLSELSNNKSSSTNRSTGAEVAPAAIVTVPVSGVKSTALAAVPVTV